MMTLSSRVDVRTVGPCRVLLLKTPVQSVVSWQGSFLTYPDMADGDKLLQSLTVQLLDKGTQLRDRFAIADILENKGAGIHFISDLLRVGFSGHALREDVPETLRIMAESVKIPLLSAEEFDKVKMTFEVALQQARENTAICSTGTLKRKLFSTAHPLFDHPPEETLHYLRSLTVDRIRSYHASHFGARDMLLVFVGDIDAQRIVDTLEEVFDDWPAAEAPAMFAAEALPHNPGQTCVSIPGKPNLDVRFGHGLSLRHTDVDYLPLRVGLAILGGNFSARLMQKIREEMGLTYGISARTADIGRLYDGYVVVGLTLSQENLERGLEATCAEVRHFVKEGPSEEELAIKKMTICGSYKVGLGTTSGLANVLYGQACNGFDVDYLEGYPEKIQAVTRPQICDAVQRHVRPDAFHTTIAGTLPPLFAGHGDDRGQAGDEEGQGAKEGG